jgi:chorismate mutase/prephenate dehydratase
MSKLDDARLIINECDKELINIFKRRMSAARLVAEYKKENNLPILDKNREDLIIEKNINLLNDKELEEYYLEFFKSLLKVSKDFQTKLNED